MLAGARLDGIGHSSPLELEVSFLSSRRASAGLWQNLASYRFERRSSERVMDLRSAVAICRLLTATAEDPAAVTVALFNRFNNSTSVPKLELLTGHKT
jgi:hypothetical protein